jgi:hypothetical protein
VTAKGNKEGWAVGGQCAWITDLGSTPTPYPRAPGQFSTSLCPHKAPGMYEVAGQPRLPFSASSSPLG